MTDDDTYFEVTSDILDKEEIKKLISRLGVDHCYVAPSDIKKARCLLAEQLLNSNIVIPLSLAQDVVEFINSKAVYPSSENLPFYKTVSKFEKIVKSQK